MIEPAGYSSCHPCFPQRASLYLGRSPRIDECSVRPWPPGMTGAGSHSFTFTNQGLSHVAYQLGSPVNEPNTRIRISLGCLIVRKFVVCEWCETDRSRLGVVRLKHKTAPTSGLRCPSSKSPFLRKQVSTGKLVQVGLPFWRALNSG